MNHLTVAAAAMLLAVSSKPCRGELIDSLWLIIDLDLKGVIPLENLLTFHVKNNDGRVSIHFSQDDRRAGMCIDLPIAYNEYLPQTVYAYDDGQRQTILLPSEAS